MLIVPPLTIHQPETYIDNNSDLDDEPDEFGFPGAVLKMYQIHSISAEDGNEDSDDDDQLAPLNPLNPLETHETSFGAACGALITCSIHRQGSRYPSAAPRGTVQPALWHWASRRRRTTR